MGTDLRRAWPKKSGKTQRTHALGLPREIFCQAGNWSVMLSSRGRGVGSTGYALQKLPIHLSYGEAIDTEVKGWGLQNTLDRLRTFLLCLFKIMIDSQEVAKHVERCRAHFTSLSYIGRVQCKGRKWTVVQSTEPAQISLFYMHSFMCGGRCMWECLSCVASWNHYHIQDTELFRHHQVPLSDPFVATPTPFYHA